MPVDFNTYKIDTKPQLDFVSAKDFLENSIAIRDARRKKAIEEAMAVAQKEDGTIDTQAARKHLIESGFGENQDQVESALAKQRQTDFASTLDMAQKIYNARRMGIIDPEMADKLLRSTKQDVITSDETPSDVPAVAPVASQTPAQIGNTDAGKYDFLAPQESARAVLEKKLRQNTPDQTAQLSENEVVVTAKPESITPSYQLEAPAERTHNLVKSPSQATTSYMQDLFKFDNADEKLRAIGEQKPSDVLGFSSKSMTNAEKLAAVEQLRRQGLADASVETLDRIGQGILDRAVASVPAPVHGFSPDPTEQFKLDNEYLQKVSEYNAKRIEVAEKARQDLAKAFGLSQSEDIARKGDVRAEKELRLAQEANERAIREARIKFDDRDVATNNKLWKSLTEDGQKALIKATAVFENRETKIANYLKSKSMADFFDLASDISVAEGNVPTIERIVSKMLQAGVVPSSKEMLLLQTLKDNNVKDLAGFKLLDWTKLGFSPTVASRSKLESMYDDLKGIMAAYGAKMPGYDKDKKIITQPSASTKSAEQSLKEKGIGVNVKQAGSKKGRSL